MINPRRWFHRFGIVIAVALLMVLTVGAQRGRFRSRFAAPDPGASVPYDGRFTVVRLWYPHYPGWSFDYPDMERNFTLILNDLTAVRPRTANSNILRMDDPELMKYPIAYLYNMDIGDYMEHSGTGFYAVDPTNEAYKFGVNYVIYGLTH